MNKCEDEAPEADRAAVQRAEENEVEEGLASRQVRCRAGDGDRKRDVGEAAKGASDLVLGPAGLEQHLLELLAGKASLQARLQESGNLVVDGHLVLSPLSGRFRVLLTCLT